MSIYDASISLATETTYGTSAAPTRSFEAKADGWKREMAYIESLGMRSAFQGLRTDRIVPVNMGGAGELELDVLNKGFGLLFKGAFGTTTGPTQEAATSAYVQTHAIDSAGPTTSYTVQVVRPYAAASGTKCFTYTGAMVTDWELGNNVGELLTAKLSFDFQNESTTPAAAATSYPASTSPFDWTQCTATINGAASAVVEANVQGTTGLKTDRRFLRASALKKQPLRSAAPTVEGTIAGEFEDTTFYDLFVAGTAVSLQLKWVGALIASTYYYTVQLDIPKVIFTGETPEVSMDDLTRQPLPFRALHDGTNALATLTYRSTDTAL